MVQKTLGMKQVAEGLHMQLHMESVLGSAAAGACAPLRNFHRTTEHIQPTLVLLQSCGLLYCSSSAWTRHSDYQHLHVKLKFSSGYPCMTQQPDSTVGGSDCRPAGQVRGLRSQKASIAGPPAHGGGAGETDGTSARHSPSLTPVFFERDCS